MAREPIFLTPRMLPRRWGRDELGDWCAGLPRPSARIGEIRSCQAANPTSTGSSLGALIQNAPEEMLGDLGRAPPSVRLVLTDEPTDALNLDGRLGFWRIIESPLDRALLLSEGKRARRVRCRRGDLFRIEGATRLGFDAGVAACEVRPQFLLENSPPPANPLRRILAHRNTSARQVWMRDAALSVELWTLPERSVLEPDGETCHVLTALTPGACIDGAPIARGQSVFAPANGDACVLSGHGATLMVSYPDLAPTNVWRTTPQPDPGAGALRQAAVLSTAPRQTPTFVRAA